MPEIFKFEQKLIDYKLCHDKNDLIMRRFDEALLNKCDKNSIQKLYMYVDGKFFLKT